MAADYRLCQGIVSGGKRCPNHALDGEPFCVKHGDPTPTVSDRDRLQMLAAELPDELVLEALATLCALSRNPAQEARNVGWAAFGRNALSERRPS